MENYQDMQNMNEQQAPAVEPQEAAQEEQGKVVDMAQAQEKKAGAANSMNYTHKFDKPVEIMGKKYSAMTFYFEDLNGEDVEAVELELQARNIVVLSAEVSSAFQCAIAARAAHVASDELRRLPLRDYMKIKNAARNFLVAVGY